jgi:hypothetical protein
MVYLRGPHDSGTAYGPHCPSHATRRIACPPPEGLGTFPLSPLAASCAAHGADSHIYYVQLGRRTQACLIDMQQRRHGRTPEVPATTRCVDASAYSTMLWAARRAVARTMLPFPCHGIVARADGREPTRRRE